MISLKPLNQLRAINQCTAPHKRALLPGFNMANTPWQLQPAISLDETTLAANRAGLLPCLPLIHSHIDFSVNLFCSSSSENPHPAALQLNSAASRTELWLHSFGPPPPFLQGKGVYDWENRGWWCMIVMLSEQLGLKMLLILLFIPRLGIRTYIFYW